MEILLEPADCLVQKFSGYARLDAAETALLMTLQALDRRSTRGERIHSESDDSRHLYVIKQGWFATAIDLSDGSRAITEIALPGDVIGLRDITYQKHLSSLVCLSEQAVICPFTKDQLHRVFSESVKLTEIFFAMLSREQAQIVQRLVSVSRREGVARLAHVILETAIRLRGVEIDIERCFEFPLGQKDLADLAGMSAVHVSRCMSELRQRALVQTRKGGMQILNLAGLMELAEFNEQFLQPDLGWLSSIPCSRL